MNECYENRNRIEKQHRDLTEIQRRIPGVVA